MTRTTSSRRSMPIQKEEPVAGLPKNALNFGAGFSRGVTPAVLALASEPASAFALVNVDSAVEEGPPSAGAFVASLFGQPAQGRLNPKKIAARNAARAKLGCEVMVRNATTPKVATEIPILDLKREIVDHAQRAQKKTLSEAKARAEDAREAATHEENRPENDKDMRSTEASYIARGQAERVAGMERGLAKLASLELLSFADGKPIAVSALVTLTHEEVETHYLLVAEPGGITVDARGMRVSTLATTSPLGRALLGQHEGDEVTAGPKGITYEIASVK